MSASATHYHHPTMQTTSKTPNYLLSKPSSSSSSWTWVEKTLHLFANKKWLLCKQRWYSFATRYFQLELSTKLNVIFLLTLTRIYRTFTRCTTFLSFNIFVLKAFIHVMWVKKRYTNTFFFVSFLAPKAFNMQCKGGSLLSLSQLHTKHKPCLWLWLW